MRSRRDQSELVLDAALQEQLEALASAAGESAHAVLKKALDEYAARHNGARARVPATTDEGTVYDRWARLGVIGCIEGEPGTSVDLSTNPAYLNPAIVH